MYKESRYNLFYRIASVAFIILHLATFGPLREALAFQAKLFCYNWVRRWIGFIGENAT